MTILIKNGTVINPATDTNEELDVLVSEGAVKKLGKGLRTKADRTIEAKGMYVFPGFVDLHVHLRDPGFTAKETVDTGMRAAAAGGYTTILAMPNTRPVVDNADVVSYVHNKARAGSNITVRQIGAITKGQQGERLADLRGMHAAGSPGFSDDGYSVKNARLYFEAMHIAKELDVPIFTHCEDLELDADGVVNYGPTSERLSLPGMLPTAENSIMVRDKMLAIDSGCRLHFCHCSTQMSYTIVKDGVDRGYPISGEVTPHHFTLCDEDIPGPNTNYKMNPPLRGREDMETLRKGIAEGIFVIATDHAPHTRLDKNFSMREAPFGIVGLETAAALTYDVLVKGGYMDAMAMARAMSYGPARIAGLEAGDLSEGKRADIAVFDPSETWTVRGESFKGKSCNMPYEGRKVTGRVKYTIAGGQVEFEDKP